MELAETGRLSIETEQFPFSQVPAAYERLRSGTLSGRAVVTVAKT